MYRLREALREAGMTQSQLASMVYCSQSTIARWCDGAEPDDAMKYRIVQALGVDPEVHDELIETLSVAEAAKIMGMPQHVLKLALQQGRFEEWGKAIETERGGYYYWINKMNFERREMGK